VREELEELLDKGMVELVLLSRRAGLLILLKSITVLETMSKGV